MPLACDPTDVFDVVLPGDEKRPAEVQRKIVFRYLSAREYAAARKIIDGLPNDASDEQVLDALDKCLKVNLVDAKNFLCDDMTVSLRSAPSSVLTMSGMWNVYWASIRQNELTEDDRKNSASPSHTDAAASAPADSVQAGESAKTSQPPTSP